MREITLITKMGVQPEVTENDPLPFGIGAPEKTRTAGWKGRVCCQDCGSEGDWYGAYIDMEPTAAPGTEEHDEAEIDLLRQAHDVLRAVAPPDQRTEPEIFPCRRCGVLPKLKETDNKRIWVIHRCEDPTDGILVLCANRRQAILTWNRKQGAEPEETESDRYRIL